jgi:hypothetical protein
MSVFVSGRYLEVARQLGVECEYNMPKGVFYTRCTEKSEAKISSLVLLHYKFDLSVEMMASLSKEAVEKLKDSMEGPPVDLTCETDASGASSEEVAGVEMNDRHISCDVVMQCCRACV